MAERLIEPTFSRGEISPEVFGRVDTTIYANALATARNCIIHTYGGVSRRPGLKFLGPIKTHTDTPRLIPFEFKTTDQYVIEAGNLYFRFVRNDGYVTETDVVITGVTKADPGVVTTSTSHGYSNGDEVFISGVVGMIELNNNRYVVANVASTTFELTSQVTGTNINTTGFTTYSSAGTSAKIYEIVSPYAIADVFNLVYTQSADVMTITHKDYDPKELTRTDHTAWTITTPEFKPDINGPTNIAVTVGGTGTTDTHRYIITTISKDTGEESLPGRSSASLTITGATQANPVRITTSGAHGLADNDAVKIDEVVGMTQLNGNRYIIDVIASTTFDIFDEDLVAIDGTGFTAYSSAGIVRTLFVEVTALLTDLSNAIVWSAVTGASRYAIYRKTNGGLFGLIGEVEGTTFTDTDTANTAPDTTIQPPPSLARNPFDGTDNQPSAVGYYQQRRVFGGSINEPDTSFFSQTANQSNFNTSSPTQADDAITATLASNQVNEIRHYVASNDLIVFTSGSEWRIDSGNDSAFSPDTIRQFPQTEWGSSFRQPITIGNTVLYIVENNIDVRSLQFSLEIDAYTGANLNIISRHLIEGFTFSDWCQVNTPDSRFYFVRNDGEALSLTFDQEQETIAWTRFDTKGKFRSCVSLRGGGTFGEDSVYWVVERTVNGNTVRYLEVMRDTHFDDVRDCFFVDSGLSLDVPIVITGVATGATTTITAPSHGLSDDDEVDLFDIIWVADEDVFGNLTQPDQLNTKRYTVDDKTANTFRINNRDGDEIDSSTFNAYVEGGTVREAVSTVSGLDHLEGETVIVLGDGNVVKDSVVTGGKITFTRKFSRIHAGLVNVTDIETLPLEGGKTTMQGRLKNIVKVVVRFFKSRGVFVGPDNTHLIEMKQREFEKMGDPTGLLNGSKEIVIEDSWNADGQIFIRQPNPLPLTILSIVPVFEIEEGFRT